MMEAGKYLEKEVIEVGRLNKRVYIQQDTSTAVDENNNHVFGFVDIAKRWASIEEIGGKEIWFAQQVQTEANIGIVFRYFKQLDETMRIRYNDPVLGNRYFNVVNKSDINERHIKHAVQCKETDGGPNT